MRVLMCEPHHGNILSGLLELIFDAPGDVPQVRQRERLKLDRPQDAGVRLKHLQSLRENTKNVQLNSAAAT